MPQCTLNGPGTVGAANISSTVASKGHPNGETQYITRTIMQPINQHELPVAAGCAGAAPAPNRYAVTYDSPSASSLGAMPLGNGRTSANIWVEAATGDLMLSLGLADALDENSNLLKLGLLRVRLQPPLDIAGSRFNQTLNLASATAEVSAGDVEIKAWVDASTSTVRLSVTTPAGSPTKVVATLDHDHRLTAVIDGGAFGNGWGGPSGSFCYANGTIASFVGIYPDALHSSAATKNAVAWSHRNLVTRSDMYGDAMKQQGLAECGPACWDPLTNRSFGAALVGGAGVSAENATALSATTGAQLTTVQLAVAVASAQTDTATEWAGHMDAAVAAGRKELAAATAGRAAHELWWSSFFNRSWIHVTTAPPPLPPPPLSPPGPPPSVDGYYRHDGFAGVQKRMMLNASWPLKGKSPGSCTASFTLPGSPTEPLSAAAAACVRASAAMCTSTAGCAAFALSGDWHGGTYPQLFAVGMPGDHCSGCGSWGLFVKTTSPPAPPMPPPPPPVSDGFRISRQYVLMRYMDLCSSGRIGGGATGNDYLALKYNGGILTAEPVPREDYRAWGPGQWWQNLRLPYYAMLAEGGGDMFKPLLRWYLSLLPMAKRRTALWFSKTDSTGRDLSKTGVHGAWFIETMTQFGTYVPSEKGYHCTAVRLPEWTVDWAGNKAINLHREGSVELLHMGLDYFEHTLDEVELRTSILPLSIAVTDFVDSYYGRTLAGKAQLEIWPTQSLEGYRPGSFPPTHNNTIKNDMPWVAGLHAVLPRLIRAASGVGASGKPFVSVAQLAKWKALLAILPQLPTGNGSLATVFTAAQVPYPPHAVLGGSEQPMMYPIHPYRLSSVVEGGQLLEIGKETIGANKKPPTVSIGDGWKQGVMNVALLGLRDLAAAAVLGHASTPTGAMRFPAYLPNMQDFRPNEDHLSNMRSALQYMLLQHSNSNASLGLLPAWPCDKWSAEFKLHAPGQTTIQGSYNHTTSELRLIVQPPARRNDVVVMGCAKHVTFV